MTTQFLRKLQTGYLEYNTGYTAPRLLFSSKCMTLNDPEWLFHVKFWLPCRREIFGDRVVQAIVMRGQSVTFPIHFATPCLSLQRECLTINY